MEHPDLVEWNTAQEILLSNASGQDAALILGIRREGTPNLIWEDVYKHALVYYHLGFKTFVAYDDSFTAIKRVFTAFSKYIKERGANVRTVFVVICGSYTLSEASGLRLGNHDECDFLKDLIHDIGTSNQARGRWPFILRDEPDPVHETYLNDFFQIRREKIEDLVCFGEEEHILNLFHGKTFPFFFHGMVDFSRIVDKSFNYSSYWHHLRPLSPEQEEFKEEFKLIRLLSLSLELAKQQNKKGKESTLKVIVPHVQAKLREQDITTLERICEKASDFSIWLTCWTIIKWEFDVQERPQFRQELLQRLKIINDNQWKDVTGYLGSKICTEAVLDTITSLPRPSEERKEIPWERLGKIVEAYQVGEQEPWRKVTLALFGLLRDWNEFAEGQRVINEDLLKAFETTVDEKIEAATKNFATTETVDEKIEAAKNEFATIVKTEIEAAKQDLATETFVNEAIEKKTNGLATETFVNEAIKEETTDLATTVDTDIAVAEVEQRIDKLQKWQFPLFLLAVLVVVIIMIVFVLILGLAPISNAAASF